MCYRQLPTIGEDIVKRFWNKVSVRKNISNCWEWNSSIINDGYGLFTINYTAYLAHRVAYFIGYNIDPQEKQVCHSCDNPKCVNPNHLFLGTIQDNVDDKMKKGRHKSSKGCTWSSPHNGTKVNTSKLDEAKVIEIRKLCEDGKISQKKIATQYGINRSTVQRIFYNQYWQHIA